MAATALVVFAAASLFLLPPAVASSPEKPNPQTSGQQTEVDTFIQVYKTSTEELTQVGTESRLAIEGETSEINHDNNQFVAVDVLKAGLSQTEQAELTLKDALLMSMDQNLGVKQQEAKTDQARARYYTRLAKLMPNVELDYQASDYNGGFQIFSDNVLDISRRIQQPALLFKFPVFRGGADWFQLLAARKELQAQKAATEGSEQATLRQTALEYYELKRQLSNIKIAQKQYEEVETNLELTQTRMDAGVGTRLEVAQTKAQLAQAKQASLNAVQAAQVAALKLNQTLNLPAIIGVVPDSEDDLSLKTLVDTSRTSAEMMNIAKQNRKELQVIQKRITALKRLRLIAVSAFLPDVDIELGVGSTGPTLNNQLGYNQSSFGINFNFEDLGLSAITALKENNAQIDELIYKFEEQERTLETEIAQAYLDTLNKASLVDQAKVQIEASSVAVSDSIDRLKLGVGRNIDVLDAETRLTEARQNFVAAVMQYNQAHVNLVYALGLASVETLTQGVQLP